MGVLRGVRHLLQGRKVTLRPLRKDDLPARLAMINNPEVQMTTIGLKIDPNTEEDIESWLELVSQDPYSEQWSIDTRDGKYIGDIDIHSIHVVWGEAWISPMIGDLDYIADHEYRREAMVLVATYLFHKKGITRLLIDIPSIDRQGINIVQELGFQQVEEMELDVLTGVKTVTFELRPQSFLA